MAKYKHIGTLPLVLEPGAQERHVQPGETFDATLTAAQEAFWLKTGAIEKVAAPVPDPGQE